MKKGFKLIGLTGTNGSGKGEAVQFFHSRGYESHSLSDLIREALDREGLKQTRDNMIKKGNELRETGGADILARKTLQRITGNAIIDSIRNPDEIRYFKKTKSFVLLAIDAPVELRYLRTIKRGRDESAKTLKEFIDKEAEEKTDEARGQQLQTCMDMADFVVINDGTLEEFYEKLEKYL
jgi:dephospho-CoA kinase